MSYIVGHIVSQIILLEGVLVPPFGPRAVRALGPHGFTTIFNVLYYIFLVQLFFGPNSPEGKVTSVLQLA